MTSFFLLLESRGAVSALDSLGGDRIAENLEDLLRSAEIKSSPEEIEKSLPSGLVSGKYFKCYLWIFL